MRPIPRTRQQRLGLLSWALGAAALLGFSAEAQVQSYDLESVALAAVPKAKALATCGWGENVVSEFSNRGASPLRFKMRCSVTNATQDVLIGVEVSGSNSQCFQIKIPETGTKMVNFEATIEASRCPSNSSAEVRLSASELR